MNQEIIMSFICIVQQQTISAAAKTLLASQSTISHRIQVLEQELGVTLFDRQRGFKKMTLTEDGKRFYPLAMQWLELNSQMHQIHSNSSAGKVRIGSMDSMNQYLLSPIFHKIKVDIPELQMEFVSYHSQEIYSRLTSQLMDVAFAFYPIRYDIQAKPVFSEPMYMICLPGYYPEGALHPSVLKKSDQILFTWDENILRWNNEWWDEHEPPFVKVDSCGLLTTFLTDPLHWALAPASVATSFRAQFGLEIHRLTAAPPNRICYMLIRKNSSSNIIHQGVETFVKAFNECIKKNPWRYTGGRSSDQPLDL